MARRLRRDIAPVMRSLEGAEQARPVVLLPGFCAPRRSLLALERRIRGELGRPALRFPLATGPLLPVVDVRRSAERAEALLDGLTRAGGFDQVDVVGHSLGGLVAAYWLKRVDRGRRIRRVVTLGSPHGGTPFAWQGALLLGFVSRAAWQMIPGSSLLRELARTPVPPGSELIALGSRADRLVPAHRARAAAAPRQRSVELERVGHFDFLWSRTVFGLVATALAAPLPR